MQRFFIYFTLAIISFFVIIFSYSLKDESKQPKENFCNLNHPQRHGKEIEYKATQIPQIMQSDYIGKEFVVNSTIITEERYQYLYKESPALKPKYIYGFFDSQTLSEVEKDDFHIVVVGDKLKLVEIQGHAYFSTFASGMLLFIFEHEGKLVGIEDSEFARVFATNPSYIPHVNKRNKDLLYNLAQPEYEMAVYPMRLLKSKDVEKGKTIANISKKEIKEWHNEIRGDFKLAKNELVITGYNSEKYPIFKGDPKTLLKLYAFKEILPVGVRGEDYEGIIKLFEKNKGEYEFKWVNKLLKQIKFPNPAKGCPFL